jgi:cytoskeletal protein CcmA (bactofilin family)
MSTNTTSSAPATGQVRNQPMSALRPSQNARREADRRTLTLGRGMTVSGVVRDCERLVVEGVVETALISVTELNISLGGLYKGEADTEDADIAGIIEGVITVRGSLVVRSTGKLIGTVRCRRLQVEDGGQISGQLEMLTGDAV